MTRKLVNSGMILFKIFERKNMLSMSEDIYDLTAT